MWKINFASQKSSNWFLLLSILYASKFFWFKYALNFKNCFFNYLFVKFWLFEFSIVWGSPNLASLQLPSIFRKLFKWGSTVLLISTYFSGFQLFTLLLAVNARVILYLFLLAWHLLGLFIMQKNRLQSSRNLYHLNRFVIIIFV